MYFDAKKTLKSKHTKGLQHVHEKYKLGKHEIQKVFFARKINLAFNSFSMNAGSISIQYRAWCLAIASIYCHVAMCSMFITAGAEK